MAPPLARWKPGNGSPFARPAFPFGSAPYRPPSAAQATGLHTYGAPAAPVGEGPVKQYGDSPPVAWPGQWRPSEADIARWGGRVVLYGSAVPDHADSGTEEFDVLDATLPWPMGCDLVLAAEALSPAAAWATPIVMRVKSGIGRAGWQTVVQLQNNATGFASAFPRQPFRQINIRARFLSAPAAGEVIACSAGFGLVGV